MFRFNNFIKEEDGAGVVELILILVVLIGIVLIFKDQLTDLVFDIFDTIFDQAGEVWVNRMAVLPYLEYLYWFL